MPSDNAIRRVAVRIKLEADRIQLFHLLIERVERLIQKYGVHSSIDLEPIRPSCANLPSFLYADPAVLESVYRNDMMTGVIIVPFYVQHLCSFGDRPVAREMLTWKPISHWGQAIVSAIEGIDNGLRTAADSINVFSQIVAVWPRAEGEYLLNANDRLC